MNAEVKALWLEALRSGRFTQGTGYLKRAKLGEDDSVQVTYCCLGVLCELFIQQEGSVDWKANEYPPQPGLIGDEGGGIAYEIDRNNISLPLSVMDWANLRGYDPYVPVTYPGSTQVYMHNLSHLNDGSGGVDKHTFEQIADLIEKHL